ncbi:MAG: DUF167 domain-containing protein [Actinobacteria bacterium]|nr:DUF167 domain-containing protein [Actinomycetota bacterium]MBV8599437.1 DUF167 domain-containing protein [Actinomycetota bacterium]
MTSTRVRLRVAPGAVRTEVVGRHGDGWKVRVAAQAEDGRANEVVLRLVADALGLPRGAVGLVSGHAARDKVVVVEGVAADEAASRLDSATARVGKEAP